MSQKKLGTLIAVASLAVLAVPVQSAMAHQGADDSSGSANATECPATGETGSGTQNSANNQGGNTGARDDGPRGRGRGEDEFGEDRRGPGRGPGGRGGDGFGPQAFAVDEGDNCDQEELDHFVVFGKITAIDLDNDTVTVAVPKRRRATNREARIFRGKTVKFSVADAYLLVRDYNKDKKRGLDDATVGAGVKVSAFLSYETTYSETATYAADAIRIGRPPAASETPSS